MTTADAVRRLANQGKSGEVVLLASVVEVNDNNTVDVEPLNGDATIYNVRLNAEVGASKGFIYTPKVGSVVAVYMLNKVTSYVALFSELQSVSIEIDTVNLTVTEAGYFISRGDENLKQILSDLITAINQLTVSTPMGPSGTPLNATAFTNISTRISNLLTDAA